MLNSSASKAPITAVAAVIVVMKPRMPRVQAHMNAKNPRGIWAGGSSGKGATRRSNSLYNGFGLRRDVSRKIT